LAENEQVVLQFQHTINAYSVCELLMKISQKCGDLAVSIVVDVRKERMLLLEVLF